MKLGFVIIIVLLIFLIANTGIVLYRWMRKLGGRIYPMIALLTYGILTISILVLYILSRKPNISLPSSLLKLSHYGLGILLYVILFVNSTALLLFIARLVRLLWNPKTLWIHALALIISVSLALGLSFYGIINAKQIKTVQYTIDVEQDKALQKDLKIALVSDLHMGYLVDAEYVKKIADSINQIQPDIVCIAGDLFDGDITAISDMEAIVNEFRSIESVYGVYACLGNHDAGEGYEQMLQLLSDAGVRVLLDEYEVIDNRFILAGRRDSSPIGGHDVDRTENFYIENEDNLPVVVLDHQPANISQYQDADLILCGHTHKGQIFPANLVTELLYDVDYGYYRETNDSPQVIVTSGVGTWGPAMRIGSNNEVVEVIIK